ncbi:MAG TPA: Holliday junction branch migration protein RuvA [Thermodesulfatator atlanticus]|uniref:Holliday junction branch migration complex subunit RuvA n=1 Tax=Thermodesulfatator atlanticus TaxID=501497 RepID=A0A7V5U209_9BACT|nr:Holliday junction branch migration protein RuvA [Thermodesulfatator atlanticus]
MLAEIKGRLKQKQPGKIYLEASPFVFEIYTPFNLDQKLPPPGEVVRLFVSLKIRQETPELYGFLSNEAKTLFERLQTVSRLGPRLALNILATFEPEEFARVVAENDVKSLARVPGIGPRRAERLCVEFRNKLGLIGPRSYGPSPLFHEALSVLLNLGFSNQEARPALEAVFEEGEDLAIIIKKALKRLSDGSS